MSRCARCDQEVTAGYVLCRRCYERMEGIKEAAIMQEEYQQRSHITKEKNREEPNEGQRMVTQFGVWLGQT